MLLVGCGTAGAEGPAPAPPPPSDVSVITVRSEPLALADELPGRVVALRVTEVRPQVSGIVQQRAFTEGEAVRDSPLDRIDAATFRANVAAATAALERSRAGLAQAELQAQRARQLFERHTVPQQNVDDAETNVALAGADVAQSLATLQRARLDLRYATITAPIAGQIGDLADQRGRAGRSERSRAARDHPADRRGVRRHPAARGASRRAARSHGARRAHERRPGGGHDPDDVGRTSPSAAACCSLDISVDPGTGELTIRALVPNADRQLLPGMFARARIARGQEPDVITVPQQAVQRDATSGAQVFVVGEDGAIAVRSVVTGRVDAGRYVISRGLTSGERVVVEGHGRLAPGTIVNPVDSGSPRPATSRAERCLSSSSSVPCSHG